MERNLGLSSPVYEIPLDDNGLIVVGRIAMMWGHIIHHLDGIMLGLLQHTPEQMREYATRSLKRKLQDLWRELSKPEHAGNRRVLITAHRVIEELASDRNVVFHGLWGYILDEKAHQWICGSKSYTREEPFFSSDLKALHERIIVAAEAVDAAFSASHAEIPPLQMVRNRRQMWADHLPTGRDPPPPRTRIR